MWRLLGLDFIKWHQLHPTTKVIVRVLYNDPTQSHTVSDIVAPYGLKLNLPIANAPCC